MKKFWKNHSLSIVLAVVFFVMLIASYPLGISMQEPDKHPYWVFWLAQTIVSLEADICGALILVLFTKWFKERGTPTSRDTKEEIAQKKLSEVAEHYKNESP